MNNYISDIYIKSFKGISNLKLKDIKLINILTGGNNSGKTSVLEVIQNMKNSADLLLDEFETAIHTSAMNKTFKWIIESCKKLNVQVFMTSHSKEEIDKVLKCSPECIDDMAVYTLYKDSEGTSVRRLDGKMAIEAQDEMGLELR